MGYIVHKFTDWHYRVTKDERNIFVDIYPTTKKYIVHENNVHGIAEQYEDVREIIEKLIK